MRIAIVIILILIILALLYSHKEDLTDSAQAKALLKYHMTANPGSFDAIRKMYMENLENKNENPALIAMLYR
jgi:hypothetical protein